MRMIEYVNPNLVEVTIMGPDGKKKTIGKYSKVILSDFYLKYTPKKLRVVRVVNESKKDIAVENVQSRRARIKAEASKISPRKKKAIEVAKKRPKVSGGVRAQKSPKAQKLGKVKQQVITKRAVKKRQKRLADKKVVGKVAPGNSKVNIINKTTY